jgi:ribonucleoside-triphosphate reductase
MTRIARLEGVKARVAPISIWKGPAAYAKADDDVSEIFKNGRVDFAGLYRYSRDHQRAVGDQHMYDSEALREKGIAIVQRLRDAVDQWKKRTGYGFSLCSTPSEKPVRPLLPSGHRRVWH